MFMYTEETTKEGKSMFEKNITRILQKLAFPRVHRNQKMSAIAQLTRTRSRCRSSESGFNSTRYWAAKASNAEA